MTPLNLRSQCSIKSDRTLPRSSLDSGGGGNEALAVNVGSGSAQHTDVVQESKLGEKEKTRSESPSCLLEALSHVRHWIQTKRRLTGSGSNRLRHRRSLRSPGAPATTHQARRTFSYRIW